MRSFLETKTIPQEITSIRVHVRVGLKYKFGEVYFSNGMTSLHKKYKKVVFLRCTNNSPWVKRNLSNLFLHQDAVIVTNKSSKYEVDFGMLVSCNHSLIPGNNFLLCLLQ